MITKYYENSKNFCDYTYVDEKRHGISIKYYDTSHVWNERFYVNGRFSRV